MVEKWCLFYVCFDCLFLDSDTGCTRFPWVCYCSCFSGSSVFSFSTPTLCTFHLAPTCIIMFSLCGFFIYFLDSVLFLKVEPHARQKKMSWVVSWFIWDSSGNWYGRHIDCWCFKHLRLWDFFCVSPFP